MCVALASIRALNVAVACGRFRASLYPCPETPAERREMAIGVMTRIEDLNTVLSQTQDHRQRVLVAAAKNIKVWFIKVRAEKNMKSGLSRYVSQEHEVWFINVS